MPTSRLAVLTATACLGACFVQGCGGSDSDSEATSAPARTATETSTTELGGTGFVSELDALCKSGNEQVKSLGERSTALQRRINSSTGPEQDKAVGELAMTMQSANKISGEVIGEIRALDPPASERKFFDSLVKIVGEQQATLEKFAAALKARDGAQIQETSRTLAGIATQRRKLIADHGGFKYCGTA